MTDSVTTAMPDSIPRCINSGGIASRILLPGVPVLEQELQLGPEELAALSNWQARVGEIFTVCDPEGGEYRARITALTWRSVSLNPFARVSRTESPVRIQLFQALPEKERFELILQKATEIGVNQIVPFTCRRSTTLQERDAGQKKSHRWPDVVLRAARQCRRAEIPELYPVLNWQQALDFSSRADLRLLCYEGSEVAPVESLLRDFSGSSVAVLIGPEGGLDAEEIGQASRSGVIPVGLGPRILRTETAAITAAGIIQYALGDLGRKPVS